MRGEAPLPASRIPKLFQCLPSYGRGDLLHDGVAGITVGLVALPLAMAFAISSGVPPQAGIYAAIVAGFVVSTLGGSRCQVSGPTGAFVVVVAGIVATHGIEGLFLCTLLAGIMLIFLGATGMGTAVKFVPRPVVVGFTNGIAILIASTQIRDLLGLSGDAPGEFIPRMKALAANLGTLDPAATALAAGCLVTLIVLAKFVPRVPGTIVVLVGGTLVASLLSLNVATIGTRFGGVPAGLPHLTILRLHVADLPVLFRPALTIALLGALESLMSAVVSDRMSGDRHNPNVELVGQGIGNVLSPLFGGLPITGAIARTATNIRAGARTPVSGIIHAVTLVTILLLAAPLAAYIPLAVLGAILVIVAYNMGDWGEIGDILKLSKTEIAVWGATFALTVLADLTIAVEVGMTLAALLFIRGVSETTTVSEVTTSYVEAGRIHTLQDKEVPSYMAIFRIHGPFLFGVTDKLDIMLDRIDALPGIVALRLRNMTALDATGLHAIEHLAEELQRRGKTLLVCGIRPQPARLMEKTEFWRVIGRDNICESVAHAIDRARFLYESGAPNAAEPSNPSHVSEVTE
jgi:SulP family sulfate permease